MTTDFDGLLQSLLRLPPEERAAMAAVLTDSLGQEPADEVQAAWVEEAKHRLERTRSGESVPISSEVVEQELDEIVARASGPAKRAAG